MQITHVLPVIFFHWCLPATLHLLLVNIVHTTLSNFLLAWSLHSLSGGNSAAYLMIQSQSLQCTGIARMHVRTLRLHLCKAILARFLVTCQHYPHNKVNLLTMWIKRTKSESKQNPPHDPHDPHEGGKEKWSDPIDLLPAPVVNVRPLNF